MSLLEYELTENPIARRLRAGLASKEVKEILNLLRQEPNTVLHGDESEISRVCAILPASPSLEGPYEAISLLSCVAIVKGNRGTFLSGQEFHFEELPDSQDSEEEEKAAILVMDEIDQSSIEGLQKEGEQEDSGINLVLAKENTMTSGSDKTNENLSPEDLLVLGKRVVDWKDIFGEDRTGALLGDLAESDPQKQQQQPQLCAYVISGIPKISMKAQTEGTKAGLCENRGSPVDPDSPEIKDEVAVLMDEKVKKKKEENREREKGDLGPDPSVPYFGALKSPPPGAKKRLRYSALLNLEKHASPDSNKALDFAFAQMRSFSESFPSLAEGVRPSKFRTQCEKLSSLSVFAQYDTVDTYNSIERYLFERLWPTGLVIPDSVSTRDKSLHNWIAKLSFVSGRHLDIPTPFIVNPKIYQVQRDMQLQDEVPSPEVLLRNLVRNIFALLEIISTSVDEDGKTFVPSADNLLPLLTYCLIKANPHTPKSNIYIISNYRSEHRIMDEANYLFTHYASAIYFIENITSDLLTIKKEEYDRLLQANEEATKQASDEDVVPGDSFFSRFNPLYLLYWRSEDERSDNENKIPSAGEGDADNVSGSGKLDLGRERGHEDDHDLEIELREMQAKPKELEMEVIWKNLIQVEESTLYRYANTTPYTLTIGDVPDLLACYKALVLQNRVQSLKIGTLERELRELCEDRTPSMPATPSIATSTTATTTFTTLEKERT